MSDINYQCTIIRITNLHKLEGLDRLKGVNIFGNQVLVGFDTKEGDLGLYFPPESQLGEEFCKANDLIRRKDEQGRPCGGMFDFNRRVRVQKFKSNPSAGFWIPISSIDYLNIDRPIEGSSFNEFGGQMISKKYIPRTNRLPQDRQLSIRKKHERFIKDQFKEHIDTEHLFRNLDKIKQGDLCIFTWKLHGTSLRTGNVLVKRKLNILEKGLRFLGINIQEIEYDYLYGSRKVIKDLNNKDQNHFYGSDLWTTVGQSYFKDKLHKGETVYSEIIGYVPGSKEQIQKGFTYGCNEGECKVFVYRITQTNADGVSLDLSWEAVKQRCIEMGVNYVTEVTKDDINIPSVFIHKCHINIELSVKDTLEKDCHMDNSHPEEGVVLRIEGLNPQFYKAKAFRFLEMETKQADKEEIDLETQQTEENESITTT